MMRILSALALFLLACSAPVPSRIVRVAIGDGWATSYDSILATGVDMLDATGWEWTLVARGEVADVRVDHADLVCALDGGGFFAPSDPTRVHVDPVCSSGIVPLVVAHELLHWAGCLHVDDPRSVLSPTVANDPRCDATIQSCVPTALTTADLAEFRRATARDQ